MIVHGLLIQYIWHILVKYSVNAVKHIFISQMKSSGINCSSNHNQEAQHAFLFSLRSLEPNSKIKLNLTVDFTPSNLNKRQPLAVQNTEKTDVSDFSSVLPCFSTGSQAKFHAFVSVSEHVILEISKETFQQQNKEIVKRLYNQSESFQLPDTQIMEAKPRSTYCQICKETFSDYLKHLSHPVHIKKSEAQSKNTMIDDLIKGLKDEGIRLTRRRRCVADEEEMECQRMPSKVRVIQMQDTLTPMRMNSSSLSRNCYSAHKAPLN